MTHIITTIKEYKEILENKTTYTNTAKVSPGDKIPKIGIGGRNRDKMINWTVPSKLINKDAENNLENELKQMSMEGRASVLRRYEKIVKDDVVKVSSYRKITNPDAVREFIKYARKKYLGNTKAVVNGNVVEIDYNDNVTINGDVLYIDRESAYVKLGSKGVSTMVGAFYSGGTMDRQLQGKKYVWEVDEYINNIRSNIDVENSVESLINLVKNTKE